MNNSYIRQGFTLIELLIVLTIIGLVLGVGVANFRDSGRSQEVEVALRTLSGDMKIAQARASAGTPHGTCNSALQGYQVVFNASSVGGVVQSTSYRIEARCTSGVSVFKSVTLPSPIVFRLNKTPTAGSVRLTYKTLEHGTDLPTGSPLIVTVTHPQSTRTRTLTVYANGEIE